MAVLESCPKYNMVAYLEKTDGNTEFHEIISFFTRCSIHYALTVSPVVSTTFVEQFWMSAKSKLINNVRYITAKVAGKPVSISEASIRSDLLFNDADGIDSLPNHSIFDAIELMGTDQHETQTTPSPRPSPTSHFTDSILEGSGGNHGGSHPVTDQAKEIKHLKAHIKKLKNKSNPGRKSAKAEPIVHKDLAFDELDDDEIDYMETEDAQDVRRTRYIVHEENEISTEDALNTDQPKVSTDRPDEGTDKQEVSTDKEKVSTDRPDEGTIDQTEGRSATPTPTPTIFGDDETIAQVLLNMSQAKAVSREKEKGVELKDVKNIERPRL
ncbi:hypothetical protein Tco_0223454 [Tanacetum coccineum]